MGRKFGPEGRSGEEVSPVHYQHRARRSFGENSTRGSRLGLGTGATRMSRWHSIAMHRAVATTSGEMRLSGMLEHSRSFDLSCSLEWQLQLRAGRHATCQNYLIINGQNTEIKKQHLTHCQQKICKQVASSGHSEYKPQGRSCQGAQLTNQLLYSCTVLLVVRGILSRRNLATEAA